MSPSPVRAMSSLDRTETTSGVLRRTLGMLRPVTTMSSVCSGWRPGAETSIRPPVLGGGLGLGVRSRLRRVARPCRRLLGEAAVRRAAPWRGGAGSPRRMGFNIVRFPRCIREKGGGGGGPPPRAAALGQVVGMAVQLPLLAPKLT